MTHNQIDYWNLVENIRHNRATEELSERDVTTREKALQETGRHNIAEEGLGAAQIRQQDISSLRSTSAQRYASELGYAASQYAADLSAATQRYSADLNAETNRYNTDTVANTQRYSIEAQRYTSMYNADSQARNVERQAEVTERGQDLNAGVTTYLHLFDASTDWLKQNTDPTRYLGRINTNLSIGGGE